MPHPRQHVSDIAAILKIRGVSRVVVSPGSRNAPLIDAFFRTFGAADCSSVVDERSAAFFALGFARRTRRPVVLLCSSGSAVLNYGPALAEARYQRIPLIAVTADRPSSWIDQQDNQTLRQEGVFANYVTRSWALPASMVSDDDLWFAQRVANEAYNASMSPVMGPVHINVPLEEPLYLPLPDPSDHLRLMEEIPVPRDGELPPRILSEWREASSILIVHGQDFAPSPAGPALAKIAQDPRVAVIAENIANVDDGEIIGNPELLLARVRPPEAPDLLIYSGGHVVSKKLKGYLRKATIRHGWRLGLDREIIDTYQRTTSLVSCPAEELYQALAALIPADAGNYAEQWREAQREARARREALLPSLPFSDLTAIGMTTEALPSGSVLELGNSAVIRYAQFYDAKSGVECHSNRGVSGIDGSLSAAVGSASASGKLTLCILGDLSFVYDSNALWNRDLPRGLRVAVVNNHGGGIFGLIGAPLDTLPHRALIEAHHPVRIDKLAEAFGLVYFRADDAASLASALPAFLAPSSGPALLEIATSAEVSRETYRKISGN